LAAAEAAAAFAAAAVSAAPAVAVDERTTSAPRSELAWGARGLT